MITSGRKRETRRAADGGPWRNAVTLIGKHGVSSTLNSPRRAGPAICGSTRVRSRPSGTEYVGRIFLEVQREFCRNSRVNGFLICSHRDGQPRVRCTCAYGLGKGHLPLEHRLVIPPDVRTRGDERTKGVRLDDGTMSAARGLISVSMTSRKVSNPPTSLAPIFEFLGKSRARIASL